MGITVELNGYCAVDLSAIKKLFVSGGASAICGLDGEFAVAITSDCDEGRSTPEIWIVTSSNGVASYFYALHEGSFLHGRTVASILDVAAMRWEWNWRALADVLQLEHVVEQETLHPSIHRVPAASVVHWNGTTIRLESRCWSSLYPSMCASPKDAVVALNQETEKWLTDETVLSMSGGFDSRVLLSSILKLGHRPKAFLTQGNKDCTDVQISSAIARRFGIPIEVVGLEPDDYVKYGDQISLLTGGTKTAANWHTYIYPARSATDLTSSFIVGSNGEFARSYLLDFGIVTSLADVVAPDRAVRAFWGLKLKSVLTPAELAVCNPEFSAEFSREGRESRISRLCRLCDPPLANGLDRFYLEQRVRNFISNGLMLYSAHAAWRTPFLGREWTKTVWNLPRRWKQGNNWHRYALSYNEPSLLGFPEEHRGPVMRTKADLFYWAPGKRKTPVVGYAQYREWFADGIIADYIRDNASSVSEVIPGAIVRSIMEQHQSDGSRMRALSFILALSYWCCYLKSRAPQR